MEERVNSIPINYTDEKINALLSSLSGTGAYTRHFTQTEDFFIQFKSEYTVPRFAIHHDVEKKEPDAAYLSMLETLLAELVRLAPDVFSGLSYFFDPAEVFKPCFYRLYKTGGRSFFYLLRMDLGFRPHYQTIIDRGDNDSSHGIRTGALFLEPLCIPLQGLQTSDGKLQGVHVRSLFSETWIGEYGRGYFIQGIWMDTDLSKFFTKLFQVPGQHLYPYYPLLCKYRTVCAMPASFSDPQREKAVSVLKRVADFLEPSLEAIQDTLKKSSFSDTLSIFRELQQKVDRSWPVFWDTVNVRAYLNENGRKEFVIENRAG